MKKLLILFITAVSLIFCTTAFRVRETITHSGVKIDAVPVVSTGYLIKMNISSVRSNQTISAVTYQIVDENTINVYIAEDFLERNQQAEEQTLQLLLSTQKEVHFLVNDQMLDTYLIKDGSNWKTMG